MPRPGMCDLSKELGVPASSRFITENALLQKVKKWIKNEMGTRWDPMYVQIADALTRIAVRPLFQFPVNPPLAQNNVPLILVGDALHALPPYTGSGGNLALTDAGELATYLVSYAKGPANHKDLLTGLRQAEQMMLKRAHHIAQGGEITRKQLLHLYSTRDLIANFSLAKFLQGPDGWSLSRRCIYGFLRFYMWCHSLSNYGLPKK